MISKKSSIIVLTVFVIHITSSQDNDNSGVILEVPICNLTDYNDNERSARFKNFAKYEECQFQLYMDKLQELDCNIMYKHENNYACESDPCIEEIFETRRRIYEQRLDVACPCDNPRPMEANSNYYMSDMFELDTREEEDKKISTLCEYTTCWEKLWTKLMQVVTEELEEYKKAAPNAECEKLGKKHEDIERCRGVLWVNDCP